MKQRNRNQEIRGTKTFLKFLGKRPFLPDSNAKSGKSYWKILDPRHQPQNQLYLCSVDVEYRGNREWRERMDWSREAARRAWVEDEPTGDPDASGSFPLLRFLWSFQFRHLYLEETFAGLIILHLQHGCAAHLISDSLLVAIWKFVKLDVSLECISPTTAC